MAHVLSTAAERGPSSFYWASCGERRTYQQFELLAMTELAASAERG